MSQEKAPGIIAREQATTRGSEQPLLLDPRRGILGPRAILNSWLGERGLHFVEHRLALSFKGQDFEISLQLRSLMAVLTRDDDELHPFFGNWARVTGLTRAGAVLEFMHSDVISNEKYSYAKLLVMHGPHPFYSYLNH